MIRIAENILQKNWRFASGNAGARPIKETKIPGGYRIENVNQPLLSGYFYPTYKHNMVNPFSVGASLTLKSSISTSVRVSLSGEPNTFYVDLVAQKTVEVLRIETVNAPTTDYFNVSLSIDDLPVGEWLEITDPHFFLSTEKPDIWTPAHADLTPEQIALMKYGEFEEAKQI